MSLDVKDEPINALLFNAEGCFRRGEKAKEFARKVFDYSFSNSFIIKNDDEMQSDNW